MNLYLALMLILWLSPQDGPRLWEPQEILARVQAQGVQKTIAEMTSGNGESWKHAIQGIQTGSPRWLAVASALREGSDAGNSEDLMHALSYALIAAPTSVLPMLGDEFPLPNVCTVPDIEPTPEYVRQQIGKAKAALARVNSSQMATKRDACIRSFSELETKVSAQHP
jgi:hypothetical protein